MPRANYAAKLFVNEQLPIFYAQESAGTKKDTGTDTQLFVKFAVHHFWLEAYTMLADRGGADSALLLANIWATGS
jgi:hypothetical protein